MDDLNPSNRLALSYPMPENFRRTWIYLLSALILCLACIFVKFPANSPVVIPGQGKSPEGQPLLRFVFGMISVFLMVFAIFDSIFVFTYKYSKEEISFDHTNLYIDFEESETVVPLPNITAIELNASVIQSGIRGSFFTYMIRYNKNNEEETVNVNIYFRKTSSNLEIFQQRVLEKNPSAYIKNSATSFGS
jgi:hypothetical protein